MSIVGDYDNGQFDDYYEICDREYDEEIYWDLKMLLDLAEELPKYITGLALAGDQEMIEYLGDSILELLNRFRGQGMDQREEEKLDEQLVTLYLSSRHWCLSPAKKLNGERKRRMQLLKNVLNGLGE